MPPTFSSPFQPNQPDKPKPVSNPVGGGPVPGNSAGANGQMNSSFRPGVPPVPPKNVPTGTSRPFTPPAGMGGGRPNLGKPEDSQKSFIPKGSLAKPLTAPRTDGPMGGLLVTISLVVFAMAIASWAAAWSYQQLVYNEINKECSGTSQTSLEGCGLRESLKRQKDRLGGEALNRIKRLEVKLATAGLLLNSHDTLVPLFDKLNTITLKTIQYRKFSYNEDGTVTVEGVARSYEDIAVQSRVFGRERTIKSFLFSDLNAAEAGLVSFKLTMSVGPELTSFVADSAIPVPGVPEPVQLGTSSPDTL